MPNIIGFSVRPVAFHDQIEQLHILCMSLFKKKLQTCYHSQIFLMDIVRYLLNKAKHYGAKRQVKIS